MMSSPDDLQGLFANGLPNVRIVERMNRQPGVSGENYRPSKYSINQVSSDCNRVAHGDPSSLPTKLKQSPALNWGLIRVSGCCILDSQQTYNPASKGRAPSSGLGNEVSRKGRSVSACGLFFDHGSYIILFSTLLIAKHCRLLEPNNDKKMWIQKPLPTACKIGGQNGR
jgi:hypothetical protein